MSTALRIGEIKSENNKVAFKYPEPVEFPKTPIYWAIEHKYPKLVALLLSHGADANGKLEGDSLLTYAAFHGCAPCVVHLVAAGADVNRRNLHGKTTLMLAASQGWVDVVKLLLDRGADVNAKTGYNTEDTALTYAKVRNHTEKEALDSAGCKGCATLPISEFSELSLSTISQEQMSIENT